MKKKIFARIASVAMALCMMIGVASSAQAAGGTMGEHPFTPGYRELQYGKDVNLKSNISLYSTTYEKVGTIKLPDDNRIHRIIFLARFCKDPSDTGNGYVRLNLQFRRNGQVIHSTGYNTSANETNPSWRGEFSGVSKNQVIDVYADAVTAPGSTPNGNLRCIYMPVFDVYTD